MFKTSERLFLHLISCFKLFFDMEITEIKQRLSLANVLNYYQLKPDKNLRLQCPFHNDKTPSLQVYYKTHTVYCFSSNCKTHGKSMDVIDFVMHKENTDKHNALLKCTEIINYYEGKTSHQHNLSRPDGGKPIIANPTAELTVSKEQFLQNMFTYFKNAVHNSKPARQYLQSRSIDFKKTEVGYNAGQFHHGVRKDEVLINRCLQYGLLLEAGLRARSGDAAYKPFGKCCICFALRNRENEIVSLYFRSTLQDKASRNTAGSSPSARHFYLRDRQGLYPGYPGAGAKKLILTESIIDAATLLEQENIKNNYEILALFGTNGFTQEHSLALSLLKELEEIIFFLNGDEPGSKAVAKYAPMLKTEYPNIKITSVAVPLDEDVNSLLQSQSGPGGRHGPEILIQLIDTRKEAEFIPALSRGRFSDEPAENKKAALFIEPEIPVNTVAVTVALDTSNPYNLKYQGDACLPDGTKALYQVKGFRVEQMDSLKITLQIVLP